MYIAFIDHYDSFSFNILDWLIHQGFMVEYYRHDDTAKIDMICRLPRPIVVSPGPGSPNDYATTLGLLRKLTGRVPILGICLGHQMLAVDSGLELLQDLTAFHGSHKKINWNLPHTLVFKERTDAVSYNSLMIQNSRKMPQCAEILAVSDDQQIQAISYHQSDWQHAAMGIQFHPESFAGDSYEALAVHFKKQVQEFWNSDYADLSKPKSNIF